MLARSASRAVRAWGRARAAAPLARRFAAQSAPNVSSSSSSSSPSAAAAAPFSQSSGAGAGSRAVDPDEDLFEDPRDAILDAALKHVAREGWTMDALAAGAQDAGYPPVSSGMFDKGPVELVWHVMRRGNEALSEYLEAECESGRFASLTPNERVRAGVKFRLEQHADFIAQGTWAQAMALGAQPSNLPTTLHLLGSLVDEIWFWSGDRSASLQWYTRRALLLGVYSATEAFMLTDASSSSSPQFRETWAFLDRRLEDVTAFGRQVGEGLGVAEAVTGGIGSLATAAFDLARPAIVHASGETVVGRAAQAASAVVGGVASAAATAAAAATATTAGGGGGGGVGGAQGARFSEGGVGGGGGAGRPSSPPTTGGRVEVMSPVDIARSAVTAAAGVVSSVASNAGVKLPDPLQVIGALGAMLPSSTSSSGGRVQGQGQGMGMGTSRHDGWEKAAPGAARR